MESDSEQEDELIPGRSEPDTQTPRHRRRTSTSPAFSSQSEARTLTPSRRTEYSPGPRPPFSPSYPIPSPITGYPVPLFSRSSLSPSPATPVQPQLSSENLARYQFHSPGTRLTETPGRPGTPIASRFNSPSPIEPRTDSSSQITQSPESETADAPRVIGRATLEEVYEAHYDLQNMLNWHSEELEEDLGPERHAALMSRLNPQ